MNYLKINILSLLTIVLAWLIYSQTHLCPNRQHLLISDNNLKDLAIDIAEVNDNLLLINELVLSDTTSYRKDFIVRINNIPVQVYIATHCGFCYKPKPSIQISINKKGQILLNNGDEFIIPTEQTYSYLAKNPERKPIYLEWVKNTPAEYIDRVAGEIIRAYEEQVEKYARKKFHKSFCFLNEEEMMTIKEKFPFELRLANFKNCIKLKIVSNETQHHHPVIDYHRNIFVFTQTRNHKIRSSYA